VYNRGNTSSKGSIYPLYTADATVYLYTADAAMHILHTKENNKNIAAVYIKHRPGGSGPMVAFPNFPHCPSLRSRNRLYKGNCHYTHCSVLLYMRGAIGAFLVRPTIS